LHEKESISWDGKAAPTKVVVVVLKYSADIDLIGQLNYEKFFKINPMS